MKPFLKWAGGKRQLLPYIKEFINKKNIGDGKYYEPFLGGGSIFFDLGHKNSIINDYNKEIINTYKVIKKFPEKLIAALKVHAINHSKDYFYQIRALDRDIENYNKMDDVLKAARTIYLNRTCYNGLYRVNHSGFFNTPIGKYVNPLICDEDNIREISKFLNQNKIKITSLDFEIAVESAQKGDWIYFDPPYDYEDGAGFVNYVKEGFNHDDLTRLKKVCDQLIEKGCSVLISNNDTFFVRTLFTSNPNYEIVYETKTIKANRNITSKKERKKVEEVLIYGRKEYSAISSSK